jgi:hypothetical protein
MSELKIGEREFVIGKMSVRKQFHVARRLGPLMAALFGQGNGGGVRDLATMKIGPIADVLAGMDDEDVDYVLDATLSVVSLRQGSAAFPIMNNGQMAYQDITMPDMLRLASEVVQRDLAGFMGAAPSSSTGEVAA